MARALTLSVHEVADGHGVVPVDVHRCVLEHGLRVGVGAKTHVLLAEALHLLVDGDGLELLRERDLLHLHLVNSPSLGGAEQHSCRQQSTLHDGRLLQQRK